MLLWRRAEAPFEGTWALPGRPARGRRAARRVRQQAPGRQGRHPPDRAPGAARDAQRSGPGPATSGSSRRRTWRSSRPDARPSLPADTAWHLVDALPPTAFDHGSIVGSARNRLRAKLSYTNIGFALAPETFTISQLRDTYAAALGHPVSATNLQRILTRRGVIEPTTDVSRPTSTGGRPATLYRFAARELVVTNPFAAFRPRRTA